MMKFALATSVVALLAAGSMTAIASEKVVSVDDSCKAMAKKDHVAADKIEAFVKTCVEKQSKQAATPAAAPAAAPAAMPATAAH